VTDGGGSGKIAAMARIDDEQIVWVATSRPDGRPHLSPIWFVWLRGRMWICTGADAVKSRNATAEPRVSVALQDGMKPAVGEGVVTIHERPYPADVAEAFMARFGWDITTPDDDGPYDALWEVVVERWLFDDPTT
jgi:hypothetical protein